MSTRLQSVSSLTARIAQAQADAAGCRVPRRQEGDGQASRSCSPLRSVASSVHAAAYLCGNTDFGDELYRLGVKKANLKRLLFSLGDHPYYKAEHFDSAGAFQEWLRDVADATHRQLLTITERMVCSCLGAVRRRLPIA